MSTEESSKAATAALWRIAEGDRIDLVDSLMGEGADINASNEHGMTALMRAAANGQTRMVSVLLAHGADPNVSRNDKFTPLLLASFFGHEEIVKLLVEHRADTSAKSRCDTSAQMWANCRNFFDVADYLDQPVNISNAAEVSDVEIDEPWIQVENETIPDPPQIAEPAEQSEPVEVRDLESIAVHGRQQVTSRFKLRWALAGFVCASLLVSMVLLTNRAMESGDDLTPAPAQKQSPASTLDRSYSNQSLGEVNLPDPKPAQNDIDDGSSLLRKQDELKPKHIARSVVSTVESTGPAGSQEENTGTKMSLPEPAEAEALPALPTESPVNTKKQAASTRDRKEITPPTPSTTQLLTGAKSGRVIRWP